MRQAKSLPLQSFCFSSAPNSSKSPTICLGKAKQPQRKGRPDCLFLALSFHYREVCWIGSHTHAVAFYKIRVPFPAKCINCKHLKGFFNDASDARLILVRMPVLLFRGLVQGKAWHQPTQRALRHIQSLKPWPQKSAGSPRRTRRAEKDLCLETRSEIDELWLWGSSFSLKPFFILWR